jgi:hypothetical protein
LGLTSSKSFNLTDLIDISIKTIFPFNTGIQFKFNNDKINILLTICNKHGASPAMLIEKGPEDLIKKIEALRGPDKVQHKKNFIVPSAYRYTEPLFDYIKGEVL